MKSVQGLKVVSLMGRRSNEIRVDLATGITDGDGICGDTDREINGRVMEFIHSGIKQIDRKWNL